MPPRRSHKKSKAGCQRCKLRKIKCDEVHPSCGNCLKHGVPCDFSDPSVVTSPAASIAHTPSLPRNGSEEEATLPFSPSLTPQSSISSSTVIPFYQQPSDMIRGHHAPNQVRQLELRLMHHYTALTAHTLSTVPCQQNAWQVEVPTIAYDFQCLMDAILAVSALHLRAIHPEDQIIVRASHGYMASALAHYSSSLNSGLSAFNAEAIFATSALIAFQASASRRFEVDQEARGYTLPLSWFHSFQGVKTVVMASWQWLRNSEKVMTIINGQPPLALDLSPDGRSFFAPILEGLDEQLKLIPESRRLEVRQAYEHSVAFLNWAHEKPERPRILSFAATVSKKFVELIAQQDPRALVIIACFFAMTRMVDKTWWLQGVAKREVMGLFSLLPEEWWPKMDWPVTIANYEGEIPQDVWGVSWKREGSDSTMDDNNAVQGADVIDHIDFLTRTMTSEAPPVD